MTTTEFEIRNMKEVSDNLRKIGNDLHGKQMMRDMTRATMIVLRDAKKNAPVDTGRLRAGINQSVEVNSFLGIGVQGIVGVSSNVEYAPYMEDGTGTPAGHAATKFPPPSALQGWARRHGLNAYAVARGIYLRGGLKPRHFLKNAIDDNRDKIKEILGDSVSITIRNHGFG